MTTYSDQQGWISWVIEDAVSVRPQFRVSSPAEGTRGELPCLRLSSATGFWRDGVGKRFVGRRLSWFPHRWSGRVLERLLRIVNLVNLDHEGNGRLFTVRPRFADVLALDRVNVFEIGVAPPLRYPPAKLRLAIGIVHINDGDGHPRIAPRILAFDRILIGADDDAVAFASHPHRRTVGRAVTHDSSQVSEVAAVE